MGPMTFHPINATTQGQVSGAENTYGQALGNLQQRQQNVQNYQQNMQSGTNMYGQELQKANVEAGYNPEELAAAQRAVTNTQSLMANVPKAVNAQNAGYGATAGQLSAQAAGQAQNINQTLGYDVSQAQAIQSRQQAALQGAATSTQAGQQTQQMQLGALQATMATAADQYKTAQADKQNLENLFEKQGEFNASEAAEYQKANAAMLQAQAVMKLNTAQATNYDLKNAQMAQQAQYNMTPNAGNGFNFTGPGGRPITVEQYNAEMGTNINPLTGQPGRGGGGGGGTPVVQPGIQNYQSQTPGANYLNPSSLMSFLNPMRSPISPLAYLSGNRQL